METLEWTKILIIDFGFHLHFKENFDFGSKIRFFFQKISIFLPKFRFLPEF